MDDRVTRGFTAGVIAGVVGTAYSYLAGALNWTTLLTEEWVAILIYAHIPPFSSGEMIYATILQIGMGGALGVIFALWLPHVDSRNLLFKGWLFSIAVWFSLYGISTLFQLMGTVPTPFKTALSHFVSATIFGIGQAVALQALTPRQSSAAIRASVVPAMKPLDSTADQPEEPANTNRDPRGGRDK